MTIDPDIFDRYLTAAREIGERFFEDDPPILRGAMSVAACSGFVICYRGGPGGIVLGRAVVGDLNDCYRSRYGKAAEAAARDAFWSMRGISRCPEGGAVKGKNHALGVGGLPPGVNELLALCTLREEHQLPLGFFKAVIEGPDYAGIDLDRILRPTARG
ncbi:MAG: hypothetical protein V4480_02190 [Patescibacteria group bacterium]